MEEMKTLSHSAAAVMHSVEVEMNQSEEAEKHPAAVAERTRA